MTWRRQKKRDAWEEVSDARDLCINPLLRICVLPCDLCVWLKSSIQINTEGWGVDWAVISCIWLSLVFSLLCEWSFGKLSLSSCMMWEQLRPHTFPTYWTEGSSSGYIDIKVALEPDQCSLQKSYSSCYNMAKEKLYFDVKIKLAVHLIPLVFHREWGVVGGEPAKPCLTRGGCCQAPPM